jgi:hypothetical protein
MSNGFENVEVEMQLDDRKVFRLMGSRPELGKPLPFGTVNRKAGIIYSHWGKKYKPCDIAVPMMLTGRRVGPGRWKFTVPLAVKEQTIFWLMARCSFQELTTQKHYARRR